MRLATVASLETCIEGDVVVQSVSPSLIATDQLASNELVLRGWGFQPGTQVRIDDQPVARLTFVSATEVRVVPVAAKRVGPQPISAQNQGSVRIAAGLLRYYANQVTYTSMPFRWTQVVYCAAWGPSPASLWAHPDDHFCGAQGKATARKKDLRSALASVFRANTELCPSERRPSPATAARSTLSAWRPTRRSPSSYGEEAASRPCV